MGKTKEKFTEERALEDMLNDRFCDDEYQYDQWKREQALLNSQKQIYEKDTRGN